ncbi:hypothetical protein EDD36DRAFT_493321 [Exophiala viscosa]|uniref:BTB domain-containing protein n=1 Tax=Exophiala viscosa TaxID=2486360 RepID=A0AAN6IH54_9EURO|nr:hypothetical protein EDD36DRAFT_493321 [Exophiala viscosa]
MADSEQAMDDPAPAADDRQPVLESTQPAVGPEIIRKIVHIDGDVILQVGEMPPQVARPTSPDMTNTLEACTSRSREMVTLHLRDLSPNFDPNFGRTARGSDDEQSDIEESDEVPDDNMSINSGFGGDNLDNNVACEFQVSSKILTSVSPVFDKMLNGPFKEGQSPVDEYTPRIISLPDDCPSMVWLFCDIVHHKQRNVTSGWELIELARFCDMYNCGRPLSAWFRSQLLECLIPQTKVFDTACLRGMDLNIKDVMQVAYLIEDNYLFTAATRTFLRECTAFSHGHDLRFLGWNGAPDNLCQMLQQASILFKQELISVGSAMVSKLLEDHESSTCSPGHADGATYPGYPAGRRHPTRRDSTLCKGFLALIGLLSASFTALGLAPTPQTMSAGSRTLAVMIQDMRAIAAMDFQAAGVCCADPSMRDYNRRISGHLSREIAKVERRINRGFCIQCIADCDFIDDHATWLFCKHGPKAGWRAYDI